MSSRQEIKRLEALENGFRKLFGALRSDDITPEQWKHLAEIRVRLMQKIQGHRSQRKRGK